MEETPKSQREVELDEIRELYERDRHVRDWLRATGLCLWRVVVGVGVILALVGTVLELPGKVAAFLATGEQKAVDSRGGDQPGRPPPYRPTRGH